MVLDWNGDDAVEDHFAHVFRSKFETLFNNVAAKLVERKLYDVIEYFFDDEALVIVGATEQHVREDVIAELIKN